MIATAAPTIRPVRTIDDLLENVSASRLGTFQQCRLKFYFRYVLGLKKAKTPALHVGTTVHSVLQQWNLMRWRSGKFDLAQLQHHFQQRWQDEQAEEKVSWEDSEEHSSKKSAWTMLETYFNQTPITIDEKPEVVEVSVDADLHKHGLPRLVGIIDLVRKGGRIVDFKTSAQTPAPERAAHMTETQLSCYSVLYREAVGKSACYLAKLQSDLKLCNLASPNCSLRMLQTLNHISPRKNTICAFPEVGILDAA